jgi:hypothetical protein
MHYEHFSPKQENPTIRPSRFVTFTAKNSLKNIKSFIEQATLHHENEYYLATISVRLFLAKKKCQRLNVFIFFPNDSFVLSKLQISKKNLILIPRVHSKQYNDNTQRIFRKWFPAMFPRTFHKCCLSKQQEVASCEINSITM